MSRVLITGSSDGLGLAAAQLLAQQGHDVILHGRNPGRSDIAKTRVPAVGGVVTGDFSNIADIRNVAVQANELGPYDAVIHNAGVGFRETTRGTTIDGHSRVLSVNVLAPYVLTALMTPPKRLVCLSSGLHQSGDDSLHDIDWTSRGWNGFQADNDSKLFDTALAFAIARLWPGTLSNSLEPGWIATRMGGAGAPDELALGHVTQAWLAVTDDPEANVSGRYFFHQQEKEAHPSALDPVFQDDLLERLSHLTAVALPTVVTAGAAVVPASAFPPGTARHRSCRRR